MQTSTNVRALFAPFLCVLLISALLPMDATGQVLLDDFEDGDSWGTYGDVMTGTAITNDVPSNNGGSQALEISLNGNNADTGGATGPAGSTVDVSGLSNLYVNFYIKTDASGTVNVKFGIENPDAGNSIFMSNEKHALSSNYRLVSLPVEVIGDPGSVSSNANKLHIQPVDFPSETFTIKVDYIVYSSGPFQPNPMNLQVHDDMEGGNFWGGASGDVTNVTLDNSDTPPSNGGSNSVAFTVDRTNGDDFGNASNGKGSPIDLGSHTNPYFNFYFKAEAGNSDLASSPAKLVVQLVDGDDGEVFSNTTNFDGYRVVPGGWRLISLPIALFHSDGSGDGTLSSIETVRPQFSATSGSGQFTAKFDYFSVTGNTALPVELAGFNATVDGRDATIHWQTASETNNAGFDLLHRAPGTSSFQEVAFVQGAGNTEQPQRYRYELDDLAPGTHRFQLRQEDLGGSTALLDPIAVNVDAAETALTLTGANPFRTSTQVRYSVASDGPVQVGLYDVMGRQVRSFVDGRPSEQSARTLTIDGSDLSPGVYFLHLNTPTTTKTEQLTLVE